MPDTCTQATGAPIVGNSSAITVAGCCGACAANAACYTWTLNQRVQPYECHLKGQMTYQPSTGNCVTGIKPAITPDPPAPWPLPRAAKSVLFLAVDDMRPSIGAYNFTLAHTPNIDALASGGLLFTRAYVQYAFCSPSRNSFMTGRRPDTTRVWEFTDHFREKGVGANWTSLPQYFKKHGYLTLGGGKLFHPASATENVGMADNDYPASWSPEFPYYPNQPTNLPHKCLNPIEGGSPGLGTWCEADVDRDDRVLTDQQIRDNCIRHLHAAKEAQLYSLNQTGSARPFFVGCGLHKVPGDLGAPTPA